MLSRVSSATSIRTAATRSSGSAVPGRPEHLGLVRGAEPVGRLERLVEDPLQLRRPGLDEPLRLLEARRIAQGLDRCVDLGVGVALGHGGAS